jgi:hypothetical protein
LFGSNDEISADISTIGLYQRSEWQGNDGIIYVLYSYDIKQPVLPIPAKPGLDIPAFFADVPISDDKIYFIGRSVALDNNAGELATASEEDAKM